MTDDYNFGEALTGFMKDYGISQGDLADITDFSRVTVNRYVNGRRTPNINSVVKMADKLNVSLDNLCGREKDGTDKQRTGNRKD